MTLPAYAELLSPAEARQIAGDAYVYGYSLVTTEVTRVQMSNVLKVEGLTAPVGQFINIPRYPPADYRAVSAPNADTLYSIAWLDLSEPQVFSHPDMGNQFYLFEITDLWMSNSEEIAEQAHRRRKGGRLHIYRSGMEGHGAGRNEAPPSRDALHCYSWSHLR